MRFPSSASALSCRHGSHCVGAGAARRLRKREIETMHRIGGACRQIAGMIGAEVVVVLLLSAVLAGTLTLLVSRFGEQLIRVWIV